MNDMDLYAFAPSGERAAFLDARVHREVANSLEHLAQACSEDPELAELLAHIAKTLDGQRRVPPLFFRTYFELVQALFDEDVTSARRLASKLLNFDDRPTGRLVHAYGDLASAGLEAALKRDGDMAMAPVPSEIADAFRALLNEGFAMIKEAIPALYSEIDGIVREILLAHAPETEKFEFDGASHYQFWGLLMLNPKHHKTPLACVEVLAHEASHSLLFGLTIDEPLVFNPDEELYVSPLRPDPRPMDGIYHATYVSARMAFAMERMAESLSGADRESALNAARQDRANFSKGLGTIKSEGRLSETGHKIMTQAEAAMSAA